MCPLSRDSFAANSRCTGNPDNLDLHIGHTGCLAACITPLFDVSAFQRSDRFVAVDLG
jgi:hypothetical protein